MNPLSLMKIGEYKISSILSRRATDRLKTLGVFSGDVIKIVKSGPGPVIFTKGNTRIGVGRGMAFRIMVVPVKAMKD